MASLTRRLTHVRWIAAGTGAGKSTVARILATRTGAVVYDGDRAERDWRFRRMASRHGETIGFVIEDLLALPGAG